MRRVPVNKEPWELPKKLLFSKYEIHENFAKTLFWDQGHKPDWMFSKQYLSERLRPYWKLWNVCFFSRSWGFVTIIPEMFNFMCWIELKSVNKNRLSILIHEMSWLFHLCHPSKYKFNLDNVTFPFTGLAQLIQNPAQNWMVSLWFCTSSLWYVFVELEKGQTLRPSIGGEGDKRDIAKSYPFFMLFQWIVIQMYWYQSKRLHN